MRAVRCPRRRPGGAYTDMSSISREPPEAMPTTWELPVAAGLAWAAVAAVLLPAGQGAASWLTGGGWLWPRAGAGLTASVGGLLAGHPGAGLAREAAAALPRPWVVYL